MRRTRTATLVLLLVASHASALWLGAWRLDDKPVSREAVSPGNSGATQATPASAVAELRKSLEQRKKAEAEEPSWDDQVAAAKEKIPAGADLEAMVKAAAGDPEDSWDLGSETAAAYGVWLDRDPMAALRWLGQWDPEGGVWEFGDEVLRHLKSVGMAKLGTYLGAVPAAREYLLDFDMEDAAEECDAATKLAIASGLPDPADRLEWMTGLLDDADDFRGQMRKIRAALGSTDSVAFLEHAFESDLDPALLEEIRKAGFPEVALKRCEAAYLDEQARTEEAKAAREMDRAVIEGAPLADRIGRWVDHDPTPSGNWADPFKELLPDFEDWCADAAEGRLAPEDVLARTKEGLPGGAGIERQLRTLVFRKIFDADPSTAVGWLEQAGEDLGPAVVDAVNETNTVPTEIRGEMIASHAANSLTEYTVEHLYVEYYRWHDKDPAACQAAIQRLPEGPVKEKLQAIGKGEAP